MSSPTEQSPTSSLVVHHLNNSRSQRILWLLEELGVPYTIKHYKRTDQQLAPKELRDVHPLGKAPVVTDGDVTIAESGAIVEYLIAKYGSDKERATDVNSLDELYWKHYAEGSLMPLVVSIYVNTLIPAQAPFFLRPLLSPVLNGLINMFLKPDLQRHIDVIEAYLTKHSGSMWFSHGERPTTADYMMLFPMEILASGKLKAYIQTSPKIRAWVDAVHARPAYQRALEKGGPYDYI